MRCVVARPPAAGQGRTVVGLVGPLVALELVTRATGLQRKVGVRTVATLYPPEEFGKVLAGLFRDLLSVHCVEGVAEVQFYNDFVGGGGVSFASLTCCVCAAHSAPRGAQQPTCTGHKYSFAASFTLWHRHLVVMSV